MKTDKFSSLLTIGLLMIQTVFLGVLLLRINQLDARLRSIPGAALEESISPEPVAAFVADPQAAIGPAKGTKQAAITIVEFADFECSACQQAAPMIEELLAKHAGEINFVYRNYPLDTNQGMPVAALAAECAHQQNGFWPMHDGLYAHRGAITNDVVLDLATSLGLDQSLFAACLSSPETQAKIQADIDAGNRYGVRSTPTFFINGRLVVGAYPIEVFDTFVSDALANQ